MTIKYPGKLGRLRPHRSQLAVAALDQRQIERQIDAWWRAEVVEQQAVLVQLCNFYSLVRLQTPVR